MKVQKNLTHLLLLVLLLLMTACEQEVSKRTSDKEVDELSALNAATKDLRLAYCQFLKVLYGESAQCVDGGMVLLGKDRKQMAGIMFDAEYSSGDQEWRYLLTLKESTGQDNGFSVVGGLVMQRKGEKWEEMAQVENLLELPRIGALEVMHTTDQPQVAISFRDADGVPAKAWIDFAESEIHRFDSMPETTGETPLPTCLGMQDGGSLESFTQGAIPDEELLKTNFERYIASRFSLVEEQKIKTEIDSVSRRYSLGEAEIHVGQVIFSDGELTRIHMRKLGCSGGIKDVYRVVQALYPRLKALDLSLTSIFCVAGDYEEFRVERSADRITSIRYDAFRNGRQRSVSLQEVDEGFFLEFRALSL